MNIIGIDLGKRTTGIAFSEGFLATPYKTIKHKNIEKAIEEIVAICKSLDVNQIVIGFVEGKIKSYFEGFAKNLKEKLPDVEIILWDETLTSRQALESLIKLQVPKTKRKEKEHENAASIILQSYLDNQ